jgi:hypothetical protein
MYLFIVCLTMLSVAQAYSVKVWNEMCAEVLRRMYDECLDHGGGNKNTNLNANLVESSVQHAECSKCLQF